MSQRVDYETRPAAEPPRGRAMRWVLAIAVGGALWWATALVLTGIMFDVSMRLHRRPSALVVIGSWSAVVLIPTLVAVMAARHVLRAGKGNRR